jgi:hypothetical protein
MLVGIAIKGNPNLAYHPAGYDAGVALIDGARFHKENKK